MNRSSTVGVRTIFIEVKNQKIEKGYTTTVALGCALLMRIRAKDRRSKTAPYRYVERARSEYTSGSKDVEWRLPVVLLVDTYCGF